VELIRRGNVWWADFSFEGKRIRKSTKQAKKTAANEVAQKMLQMLQSGESIKVKTSVPSLIDFAEQHFLPWVDGSSKLKIKSKEGYRYGWMLLQHQPVAKMRMDQIKGPHIDMIAVEGSPSTHNGALRTLRRMFSIASELEILTTRLPKIHLLTENKRTNLVDLEIEEKIAAVLARSKRKGGSLKTAMYVILDCGMRPDEISRMQIEDIDFVRGLIHVPKSKTSAGERYLPMTTRMKEKLFVQIGSRTAGWVFPSPRYPGKSIQRQALTVAWGKASKKAGVSSDVVLYCARHTFGTDAMEATKNPFKVMKMMGHTTLSTTQRYQHHDIAEVGKLMDGRNESRRNLRHSGQNSVHGVTVSN
jgi:integrase